MGAARGVAGAGQGAGAKWLAVAVAHDVARPDAGSSAGEAAVPRGHVGSSARDPPGLGSRNVFPALGAPMLAARTRQLFELLAPVGFYPVEDEEEAQTEYETSSDKD